VTSLTTDAAVSRAEVCVAACADVFAGVGESLVSPFGTVAVLGARLARLTTNPDLVMTDGEAALMVGAPPMGTSPKELVLEAAFPYRTVFDLVWSGRRHVMMMASQIDRYGNQNLASIGDWRKPKVQLIGCRGAPGNSVNHPTSYWVPDHNARTFVPNVDTVCGVGYDRAAEAGRAATRYHRVTVVVTNLAVLDFLTPDHSMRLRSVHPGVSVDDVVAATGFELAKDDEVPTSRLPTDEELTIVRDVLDPAATRDAEVKG
jgi:acyl CoA:acetate/3-ketoacid CoA transferase beta subunit